MPVNREAKRVYDRRYRETHKQERREYIRKYSIKNNKRNRARLRQWLYGLTQEQYEAMLKEAGGLCACCRQFTEKLQIDHSHATGHVRGLLCRDCNLGLGFFKDSISALEAAIAYLKKHQ